MTGRGHIHPIVKEATSSYAICYYQRKFLFDKDNMINKRFGKWFVCSEVDKGPGKHYECMCECGNFAIIPGNTLRAGRSTMCRDCMYHKRFDPMKMVGKKFGRWTVTQYLGIKNRCNFYESRCECGYISNHYGSDLRSGKSKQCATCHNRELAVKNIKHGMHNHPMYKVWSEMIQRCENQKNSGYKRYGARGIKVCDRWRESFDNFHKDMGERPEGMTLDRINNDGNYEPLNCRWVSHQENCNNRGIYNGGKKRKSPIKEGE